MLRCSAEAFAKCPTRHLCDTPHEATFTEGSECDKFNQQVLDKPMTNADRIRAMSDEDLADWLARTQIDNITEACQTIGLEFTCEEGTLEGTKAEVLEWLQQPAEGE